MSQNTITIIYMGLDMAKLNLQLHLAGRVHDVPNTTTSHRRLLKLLAALVAAKRKAKLAQCQSDFSLLWGEHPMAATGLPGDTHSHE
jgi:hypothetical protein